MPLLWTPTHIVADVALAASANFLEATGLDINRDGPYLLNIMAPNDTDTGSRLYLHINGDTVNANYYAQLLLMYGATRSSANYNLPYICYCNAYETSIVTVELYRDTDGHPRWTNHCCYRTGTNLRIRIGGGRKTADVANITEVRITAQEALALGDGTRLIISRLGH